MDIFFVKSKLLELSNPIKSSYDFAFRFSINGSGIHCWKICFREISIIMCLFFGSKCIGLSFGIISSSCFLFDGLSLRKYLAMSLVFVCNRFTNGCKTIEVFHFVSYAELFLSYWFYTQVYIYSHLSLF